MRTNEITRRIIGAAYRLRFRRQHPLPLYYNARETGLGYRVDFLVEGAVIVELKAVIKITTLFVAQTLTYMRLSNCRVGLLMNFNVTNMQRGIKRLALDFDDSDPDLSAAAG